MEQITMKRFKRTQMILLLAAAILLFFGGCGRQEDTPKVIDLEPKPVSVGSEDTEGREQTDASDVDRKKETDGEGAEEGKETLVQEALTLPLSNERVTVEYTEDIFMSSYRAMGADSIYLTGYHGEPTGTPENSDYFVGHMGIEDSEIQEFSPDIPEDMFALRACVDAQGRCHLLFTRKTDNKVTYEDMEILVINQKGETEQRVDMSMYPEYEKMKAPWYWMVTDGSGTYYFGNPVKVLALETNEGKVWLYQPEGETVEGLGIGKSGTVYGVFADENREAYLGKLHAAEGTVIRCAELPENNSRLSFSILQPGANTELLFADKGAGIWSYDEKEIKLVIPLKDIIGNGPDMVEYGGTYSPAVASGKLMENLYPYMEADESFHREAYYENILEAFELEGCLYVLPTGFRINTMCGKAEELGSKRGVTESWEIGEMIEAYEKSTNAEWLLMNNSKSLIFWELCSGCIGNYVNWETGECSFNTPEFEELLEFSDTFCDRLLISDDFSFRASLQSGQTFLQPVLLVSPWQIASERISFGDADMRWPGYPVADGEKEMGGGVADVYGPTLSICANSRNKEGAWEFIKSFLIPEVQREVRGIPLLRSVCAERIQEALTVEFETVDGVRKEKIKHEIIAEGEESIGMTAITEKDAEIFWNIVENTHRSNGWDYGMGDIISEEAGAFFEKDKDVAAVAEIIQNRVSVYIAERMN